MARGRRAKHAIADNGDIIGDHRKILYGNLAFCLHDEESVPGWSFFSFVRND
jgi:hypothetical protein